MKVYVLSISGFPARSLLDLPVERVERILCYNLDPAPELALVCRLFRTIIYKRKIILKLSSSILYKNCLSLMPNLQRLEIVSDEQPQAVLLLSHFQAKCLQRLTLRRFTCTDYFVQRLVRAVVHLKLKEFQMLDCVGVNIKHLKCVLDALSTLEVCNMKIGLNTESDMHEFASLANHMAGFVNLNLDNISAIRKELLHYPWR